MRNQPGQGRIVFRAQPDEVWFWSASLRRRKATNNGRAPVLLPTVGAIFFDQIIIRERRQTVPAPSRMVSRRHHDRQPA
jgi:hypothetical protein